MQREAIAPVDAEEMAECVEELERVASAVTRSLIICHEARRLEARRLARAGVSGVVSANENRRRSSSDSFLVLDVQHLVQHADCSRVSQLDVVGAGGVSGALIDAEKEVAKQVLLLVLLVLLVSVPCVCMCVRCLLAYGCRTIRDTRTYAHALKQYAGCCRLDGTRADATREGLSFQNHHRGLLGGARSGHGETAAVVVCLFL